MEIRVVRKLAELMNEHGLGSLEAITAEMAIRLERDTDRTRVSLLQATGGSKERTPVVKEPRVSSAAKSTSQPKTKTQTTKIFEIRSPLVGTFLSNAGGEIFVQMGSRVHKGDVLCPIKAGEQLHEITSDIEGEVIEVMARHKDEVTFDQIMFKVVSK